MKCMKESLLYDKLPGGKVKCNVCAVRCLIPEGDRGSCRKSQSLVDHLTHGLRRQIDQVTGAARRTSPRIQKSQIIIDFGDSSDCGARVVGRRFLFDRDRRREPFDGVGIRLVHD